MKMMSISSILSGNALLLRNTFRSSCVLKLSRVYSGGNFSNVTFMRTHDLRPIITKTMAKKGEQCMPGIPNVKHLGRRDVATANLQPEALEDQELRTLDKMEKHSADANSFVWPAVVIAFDIETTGFGRDSRIIEIAFRDLRGGKNSALQTLVNPDTEVRNSQIHGITTEMVTKPGVPRMKDLIPILLQYVQSRQIDGKPVVFVAHNGRSFDIPFIIREFNRCEIEFPLDWMFVDTLPLARKLSTTEGKKHSSVSLQSLREYYRIPSVGPSHRAMEDVNVLCLLLQKISFELKLSVADLMAGAFSASDLGR